MMRDALVGHYRGYIACLNRRDWAGLGRYVGEDVCYNGERIGLDGYRAMLIADVRAIPDLNFSVEQLICDPPVVAARLSFDCHPAGMLFGIAVNGRRVRFEENVFYAIGSGRIRDVRSVIDKAAVAGQC